MFYEPADAAIPTENVWSTERYLDHVPVRLRPGARRSSAPTLRLLHDVHHRLTPIEAARLGKSLEPYALTWLEDPVPAELQEGFRLIRQHTTTPIAVGEVFNTHLGLPAADHRAAHRLHPGHGRARRRHHAPAAHLRPGRALPRAQRLTRRDRPVAGLHGGGAAPRRLRSPTSACRSTCATPPETDAVFPHGYHFADGYLHPSEEPGPGRRHRRGRWRPGTRTGRRRCR